MNASQGFVSICGTSWPEDAVSFYQPVHQWIEEYFKNPKEVTDIEFGFTYINTASSKQIAKLMSVINECKNTNKINVKWIYERDDNEMKKIGCKYAELLNIDFHFVETEPIVEKEDEEGVYNIVEVN